MSAASDASTPDLSQARYATLLRLLWKHVSPRRRWQLALLVVLMLLSSFAELLTVASLVPFLVVLSDPSGLWRQPLVRGTAEALGLNGPDQLILPITLLLMAAGVMSAAIRAANLQVNTRLSALIGSDLSVEGYRRTLEQPYAVHLNRNSSEVITRLGYLGLISRGVLAPLLQALTGLVIASVLVIGLFLYQPVLAMAMACAFVATYLILVRVNRKRLHRISMHADRCSKRSLRAQQEGLGAIRDVLLDGTQQTILQDFLQAEVPLRLLDAEADALSGLPRFALEAIGMVVITGSVLALLPHGGVSAALPVVGAIALGFQRLLPAVQQIYGASTYLGAYRARLAAGLELLEQDDISIGGQAPEAHYSKTRSVDYVHELRLSGIGFSHQSGVPILSGIELAIFPGDWIGLIGETGSGKSSLLDLIMGLLSPDAGSILVDGVSLVDHQARIDRRSAWQRHIAHAPQSIFLADVTIAENIAFGVVPGRVDLERLKRAAALAQADEFVMSLPNGYDTLVGERGVRLSGGQRQRLGIARALYKQADVLILDEATSALDNQTEQAVIDSLAKSCNQMTVIMVAHRLSTLACCHRILEVKSGSIFEISSYQQLLSSPIS